MNGKPNFKQRLRINSFTINLAIWEPLLLIMVVFIFVKMREGKIMEVAMIAIGAIFGVFVYTMVVKNLSMHYREKSLEGLNSIDRYDIVGDVNANLVGIDEPAEVKVTSAELEAAKHDKNLQGKFREINEWFAEHEQRFIHQVTSSDDQKVDEFGGVDIRFTNRRDKIPYERIPIEYTLKRDFKHHFSDEIIAFLATQEMIFTDEETGVEEKVKIDNVDTFVMIDDETLKILQGKASSIEKVNFVLAKEYLLNSYDVFRRDEVQFFKNQGIQNIHDLRTKHDPKALEVKYNEEFIKIDGKTLGELKEHNKQIPGIKKSFIQYLRILKDKKRAWVKLHDWIEKYLVTQIVERETSYTIRLDGSEQAKAFTMTYARNVNASFPDYRTYEVFPDQTLPLEFWRERDGEWYPDHMEFDKCYIITPASWKETFTMTSSPVNYEFRTLPCQNFTAMHVILVYIYNDRVPFLLVTYSDWHEKHAQDALRGLPLNKIFQCITEAYVHEINELKKSVNNKDMEIQTKNDHNDMLNRAIQKGLFIKDGDTYIPLMVNQANDSENKGGKKYHAVYITFIIIIAILAFVLGRGGIG